MICKGLDLSFNTNYLVLGLYFIFQDCNILHVNEMLSKMVASSPLSQSCIIVNIDKNSAEKVHSDISIEKKSKEDLQVNEKSAGAKKLTGNYLIISIKTKLKRYISQTNKKCTKFDMSNYRFICKIIKRSTTMIF